MQHLIRNSHFVLAALVIGAVGLVVGCSTAPGFGGSSSGAPPVNSITVDGVGQASAVPNLARVQLGVMTSGPNVDVAAEESNQIIQAVMEAVTQTGVDAVDMQTSGFNVWSEELYPQDSPESSGDGPVEPRTIYRVENTVNVTVRDVDTLGDVIQSGLDAGANRVWGVEFSIEDTTQLEQEARANAVDEARARAADLAEEMGVGLGDVVSIVE